MTTTVDPTTRRVPPMGGFNTTVLRIELKRMLRNRRTLFFALVFPAGLFFAIGSSSGWQDKVGYGNVAAYIMVSMALYGGALIAASTGASVATERALGWSRQLRLRPQNSPTILIGGSSATTPAKRIWANGEDLLTQTIVKTFTDGSAVIDEQTQHNVARTRWHDSSLCLVQAKAVAAQCCGGEHYNLGGVPPREVSAR